MWSLGAFSFVAPWALAALAVLPVLWLLLRTTPPAPRLVRFPAIRMLFGLAAREETPARTPWWLVLLRTILAILLILAIAHPVINADTRTAGGGPWLIVVDDGWAAARNWPARQRLLDDMLGRADRLDAPVLLLTTAPRPDGAPIAVAGPMAAADARGVAQAMAPKPWPVDRRAAEQALAEIERRPGMRVVWLSDGVESPTAAALARRLQTFARVEALTDQPGGLAHVLMPPPVESTELRSVVRRADANGAARAWVRAGDASGRSLARREAIFADGETTAAALFDIPSELRNRVARLEIEGEASAAAVALIDERWRRRPVGIVVGDATGAATPLLSDRHYAEKALAPFAEMRMGGVTELLQRELAVAVLPDMRLPPLEREKLRDWVEGGGVLVRFAGPALARAPDDLLPVRLRGGGRTLGGSLSWTAPMALAPFPESSPFAALAIPDDIRVSRQVLAEPELDLNAKTWARLADGSPLVTAEQRGRGWVTLIHTTANPSWSNLSMSVLFVDMLRRLVAISQGVAHGAEDAPLAPVEVMDGFGRLRAPLTGVEPIAGGGFAETQPSPAHPPGFYGTEAARRALNLGPAVDALQPLAFPSGVSVAEFGETRREVDLKPWLLAAVLALAAIDLGIAMALRGLFGWRRAAAAGAALLFLLPVRPAEAVDPFEELRAVLETRLAYVLTGDAATDQVSAAGLAGLTETLARRSTAILGEPVGVDPESDELLFYPLLYWPMAQGQPPPSSAAQARLNDYMRHGGMILFDTRDEGRSFTSAIEEGPGSGQLRAVSEGLAIPPLVPVTSDHVLTRAFYLLDDLPGRYTGGTVWVERGDDQVNDGVSPVVIGGHDWAAAWAADDRGRPLVAVVPGGERQRELAHRFGVNLVMYALTGNYKADQVHLPAIMERLGR